MAAVEASAAVLESQNAAPASTMRPFQKVSSQKSPFGGEVGGLEGASCRSQEDDRRCGDEDPE
jgi:hypothetical protein